MKQGRAFSATAAASALLFVVLVISASLISSNAKTPVNKNGEPVKISIPKGQSFGDTVRQLEENGLIRHRLAFRVYARLTGQDIKVKAGRYELSPAQSPAMILDDLVSGKGRLNRLTVIEGWTVADVARAAEEGGFARASAILKLAFDPSFVNDFGIPASSLEGYLFPDSYSFPHVESFENPGKENSGETESAEKAARHVLSTMVQRFKEKFTDEMRERASLLGLSVHQVVILASVIEKETGDSREYPIIASVFYNRIKSNMRLQSDPTVIYGIPDFKGNLTKNDLHTDHPYNTYRRKGLPAGPIANPGEGAIKGALYPRSTNYFYFVSRKDGTHQFSETLEEHNRAVVKYQLAQ